MYNNSTPIGGQVTSVRGNLVKVSKSNPCPHCGKPDWCYAIGELSVCNRDQPPATGWEATSKADKDGKIFYARPQEKKPARPKQTRYFPYPARDGSPLVRAIRVDDGEGKKKIWQEHWDGSKWQKGLGDVARASIPVYRYQEVQKAKAEGQLIFTVDGEQCADIFWDLGLAATTSFGGMGKFSQTDSLDLQGAVVVITPDRDQPGLKDAEKIAQHFPDALWLYCYPESKAWENPQKSQGLDVFDWIQDRKLSADDIKAAIGEKKVFKAPAPTSQATANVIRPTQFQIPSLSELGKEIDELLDSDLKKSQVQLKISELAQKYRINSADIWKIYRDREQELEQEVNREDTAAEVARLLEIKQSKIELSEILPAQLAEPIEKLAGKLNLKPECYLAALLTQVSGLFKVGTEILLRRDTNYRCTPNYFAGIVAESSQKKSPILRAMLTLPMKPLQDKAREEYKEAFADYEKEYAAWKNTKGEDKGPAPKEPRQRIYHFSKTTGEGILYQVQAHPDQALTYRCDELASLFKSTNQYRGGKGSDDEDLLEFWNGTGSTVLRAKGVAADLDGLLLSVFGTIQPEVLAGFLKDCSDSNGKFARFDFVVQPLAASDLPDEDTELPDTTTHILSSLYKKIDALPKLEMEFDRDAKKLFATFYRQIEKQRETEPRQGTRAMLGKMPEKVGKMAAIIHTINSVVNGVEVDLLIPRSAVEAAIKFVKFTADQIVNLYTEFSDQTALAPNLMKIMQAAERQGGKISTREAQHLFHIKQRPTAQTVREWFSELQEMKHGEVTTVKKSAFLTLTTTTVTTVHQNLDTERANPYHSTQKPVTTVTTVNDVDCGNCGTTVVTVLPQSEPLPDKALKPTVVTVVTNSPPSEKSENLLLSYLTEPHEFAQEIRKAIANFDRLLALEVEEALKGKAKAKLRDEVKNALTPGERQNFKLLAKAGFLQGTRVKYVGDPKYAEQYEGLELRVHSMDAYFEIACLKPDGSLTTWMKPEELEIIS
ncbi:DUF3987 domain-containing protein [Microcoleus sp. D3_18a_C4]|uniref:DUF3987 domain-containing protein n=1 Tax=Microcoleus sp. D3_18a_C4 TaxID=3055332 RepID=UPI002FD09CC8